MYAHESPHVAHVRRHMTIQHVGRQLQVLEVGQLRQGVGNAAREAARHDSQGGMRGANDDDHRSQRAHLFESRNSCSSGVIPPISLGMVPESEFLRSCSLLVTIGAQDSGDT